MLHVSCPAKGGGEFCRIVKLSFIPCWSPQVQSYISISLYIYIYISTGYITHARMHAYVHNLLKVKFYCRNVVKYKGLWQVGITITVTNGVCSAVCASVLHSAMVPRLQCRGGEDAE